MNWLKSLVTSLSSRLLQPSSIMGYVAAVLTYLNWDVSAEGQQAIVQLVAALAAVVLFLVNEKPWIKK